MELLQKWSQRQRIMISTNQESESLRTPNKKWEDSTTKQSSESTTNIQESTLTIDQEPQIFGVKIQETPISSSSMNLRMELREPLKPQDAVVSKVAIHDREDNGDF